MIYANKYMPSTRLVVTPLFANLVIALEMNMNLLCKFRQMQKPYLIL